MRLVIIESPFAPREEDIERMCAGTLTSSREQAYTILVNRNIRYARACLRDCLLRGEAPYASHLLYTQEGVLDDQVASERKLGMEAGFAYREKVEASCVYTDLWVSGGMKHGIADAEAKGRPVEFRSLGPDWDSPK
jgi:hypothetical protein